MTEINYRLWQESGSRVSGGQRGAGQGLEGGD